MNRNFVLGMVFVAACSHPQSRRTWTYSDEAPSPDPRVGLRAGWFNAGEASWNLRLVSNTPPSESFINPSTPGDRRLVNSDIAFSGKYAIQGNYSGYQVWDISNPAKPTLYTAYVCPGSQSDVSVFRTLAFVSGESTSGRLDCGLQGVPDSVSHERLRGIRIFDISDIAHPKYLTNVQTCRGSHTHTVVTDPNDNSNVYIYVSGSAPVRSPKELEGCSAAPLDPNSALFRIEVIRVPLAAPQTAAIVSSPRIFQDLNPAVKHAETPADVAAAAAARAARASGGGAGGGGSGGAGGGPAGGGGGGGRPRLSPEDSAALSKRGPTQCHDITVYPAIGLAGGACAGYGFLLDIRDVANPKRINFVADSNFSFWHSATFNNDGTKILFSDEWGGGSQPRCRVTDKHEWGADALFTLAGDKMTFQSYYKMPAAQTPYENCVAHNGSLIPVPGRDIMVQAWYQGGISVFDWTDAAHPTEIAYFDRGPMDSTKLVDAGSWSAYWYNGYVYSSEISRGLDVFELKPSAMLSQNEIDAAKQVHFDFLNVQDQPKLVWEPTFAVARAYVDQIVRADDISRDQSAAVEIELIRAESLRGAERRTALAQLATQIDGYVVKAPRPPRVHQLAVVVRDMSRVYREQ
jgi:hypothetical protein